MSIRLRVTAKGLRDVRNNFQRTADAIPEITRSHLDELMRTLRDAVRSEGPASLRQYVEHRVKRVARGIFRGEIVLGRLPSKYPRQLWDYILYGTRPHVIEAKKAKALHFYWDREGRAVFFKRVNHPGTAPNPFPQRAYEKAGLRSVAEAAERMRQSILSSLGVR